MISFAFWKDHSDFLIEKDWREQVGLELEGEPTRPIGWEWEDVQRPLFTGPNKEGKWGLSMRETNLAKQAENPGSLREHESTNLAEISLFQEHQAQQLQQQLHLAQGLGDTGMIQAARQKPYALLNSSTNLLLAAMQTYAALIQLTAFQAPKEVGWRRFRPGTVMERKIVSSDSWLRLATYTVT